MFSVCDFFHDDISSREREGETLCETKFRLFAAAIILSYVFACTKTLTLFLSRSVLLIIVNQFIQMCVVHRKLQISNTSLILKFHKLQFIKIRTTSSMHAILMNSHMLSARVECLKWQKKLNWKDGKKCTHFESFWLPFAWSFDRFIKAISTKYDCMKTSAEKLSWYIFFWFHFRVSSINLSYTLTYPYNLHLWVVWMNVSNFIVCNSLTKRKQPFSSWMDEAFLCARFCQENHYSWVYLVIMSVLM